MEKFQNEFEEIRSLGSGAFSTVFEAKSIKDGKTYAIKKIPIRNEENERALNEIEIIRSLNSDFVVSFTDSWIEANYYIGLTDDSQNSQNINLLYSPNRPLLLHIQMELCSITLEQFIVQMKLVYVNEVTKEEYSSICEIFKQLLECVQYLHEHEPPIIHRDLKPENIMLITNENSYKVKVTDFGLSTYHDNVDQSHTSKVGTMAYRAPEVDSNYYDTKADIYSLGKIMQKLLNFDLESESNENEFEIQSLYENARQICKQCVSFSAKQRPDCKQIMSDIHLWYYNTNDSSDSISLNKNEISTTDALIRVLKQKWQNFDKFSSIIPNKCQIITVIEEIEEKVMFVTKDDYVCALRISDHIDSAKQEPKIINELSHQDIKSIVCGYQHVLCLTKDMRVYSFGNNTCGQLGNGTLIDNNKPSIIEPLFNKRIIDVKCGAHHSVALSEEGTVFVWGSGWCGQIGNGETYVKLTPIEVIALKEEKIISIACGNNHCIALSESGTLYGWGANIECGTDTLEPKEIEFDEKIAVKKFSCGRSHTLILASDGDIYSFGDNTFGQLGIGSEISQNSPTKTQTTIKFFDIETTFYHNLSVALGYDNLYYVWGECNEEIINSPKHTNFKSFYETFTHYSLNYKVFRTVFKDPASIQTNTSLNQSNEISLFKNINREFIFKITENKLYELINHEIILNIISLSAVRIKESKAVVITDDDSVYTFRLNESIDYSADEPVINNELSKKCIKNIISGYNHVLCLTESNEVYSFGNNQFGQLGNGSRINNYNPTIISELSDKKIIEISCGAYHCLTLSDTGKLFVWGYGKDGQTGIGDNDEQLIPVEINSFDTNINIVSISCGPHHCLALTSTGELYGWGDNRVGQLGIGNSIDQNKPILVGNQNEFAIKKVCCGSNYSLLLTVDHSIYSCGRNCWGQLGIGNLEDQYVMTRIETNIQFVDISAIWTDSFSAALSRSGNYYVWGYCGEVIATPKITHFTSFDEIAIKYTDVSFLTKHINFISSSEKPDHETC